MITKKIVVILGAGSAHGNLPTGAGLVQDIINMDPKWDSNGIHQWLENVGLTFQEFEPFRQSLSFCGRESVDSFLEHRPDLVEVGKKVIAAKLIPSEDISSCFLKGWGPESRFGNWFYHLAEKLKTDFENYKNNTVTFITFNYDRSLEYFLFFHLINSFGKTESEVASVLSRIPVIHFHGQLGKPHFLDPSGRNYTPELSPAIVKKCADDIYIVHEDVNERAETLEAQRKLREAERILFLGFGWNENNLRRLGFPETGKDKRIEGTAFGKTRTEMELITEVFKTGLQGFEPKYVDNLTFLRESKIFD